METQPGRAGNTLSLLPVCSLSYSISVGRDVWTKQGRKKMKRRKMREAGKRKKRQILQKDNI